MLLLLLHLLLGLLAPPALPGCSEAELDRQLVLAKIRAQVLEHLSPAAPGGRAQKERREVRRRHALGTLPLWQRDQEDTSQVILFPSTGESRGLGGWGAVGAGKSGCSVGVRGKRSKGRARGGAVLGQGPGWGLLRPSAGTAGAGVQHRDPRAPIRGNAAASAGRLLWADSVSVQEATAQPCTMGVEGVRRSAPGAAASPVPERAKIH